VVGLWHNANTWNQVAGSIPSKIKHRLTYDGNIWICSIQLLHFNSICPVTKPLHHGKLDSQPMGKTHPSVMVWCNHINMKQLNNWINNGYQMSITLLQTVQIQFAALVNFGRPIEKCTSLIKATSQVVILPKWKAMGWLEVYIGPFLFHTWNVPVIYNPIMMHSLPQFHVVHYDQFTLVLWPQSSLSDPFNQQLHD
jgi:hypothetical protein